MKENDLLDMLASLPIQEGYTPMDRYRDFRKVFLDSVEGQRVLREIVAWGRLFRAPVLGKPIDPYAMAISYGESNIAKKLLTIIHDEPTEQPQRTRKKA